jgi:AcrR family transcriptional regulator
MNSTSTNAPLGRRDQILDVAEDLFLEWGVAASSMSKIALSLGGSKGTLYNYFANKSELFAAWVERHCQRSLDAIYGVDDAGQGMGATLVAIGKGYLRRVLSEDNLKPLRLILAESTRAPGIGLLFYEAGPFRSDARLTEKMRRWSVEDRIRTGDPSLASRQFVGLVLNRYLIARLLNAIPELTAEQIDVEALGATDCFLRAWGLEGPIRS